MTAPVAGQYVELWLEHARVGAGMRGFVVVKAGTKWVRLFYIPRLLAINYPRFDFERHARARPGRTAALMRQIRCNVRTWRRLRRSYNQAAVTAALDALKGETP